MTTAKDLNDLSTIYLEAVYGGEKKKEEEKDTRYVVTSADVKGGTRAAKELAKGNPRYKKADHLKNSYEPEGEVIEDYDLVQKQRRQDAEARKHVARKEKRKEAVSKVKNVAKGFLGKKETEVDEAFKELTPNDKDRVRNQAERRSKDANREQSAGNYKASTKKDQEVRNMKKVLNNEVDLDFVNSLIESGKFTEEEIKSIIWDEYYCEGAVGEIAGSVAGGALGSAAGPVGSVVGSVAGGALGGKLLNGGGKVKSSKKPAVKTEEVEQMDEIAGTAGGAIAGGILGGPLGAVAGGLLGSKLNGGGKVKSPKKPAVKKEEVEQMDEIVGTAGGAIAGGILGGPLGAVAGGLLGSKLDKKKKPEKKEVQEEDYNYVTEYAAALGALAKGVGKTAVRQGIKVGGKAGGRAVQAAGRVAKDAAVEAGTQAATAGVARAGEAAGNAVSNIGRKKPQPETDVEEGYQRNPEKGEKEEKERSKNVRGERTPMPPRGDKRREEFEKWMRTQGM